ncbi:plexin-C1 [Clarias gariepinus]|uniref:plexin-C1 n=1 Tax=Clarias gariepinus TaxID=13013 RepID=UPI00234CC642|nr:plexin-C1 [Clarias gariepinus]
MGTVLLGIFFLLKEALCMAEYNFPGVIRHMAVGNGKVFVVTDSRLHQMRHSLSEEKFREISNSSHSNAVSILLPFEANRTLIICGTAECGYCEVLDINDITQSIYREINLPLVPRVNESYVAFLVNYSAVNGTYMLVGRENENEKQKDGCVIDGEVNLRNTLQTQPGDIFSKTGSVDNANIKVPQNVYWVDGFQASSQSYLFANKIVKSKVKVFFLKLKNEQDKSAMMRTLEVAALLCCEDKTRHKLVSSGFISTETSVLWMGIFTAEDPHHPENTALAIFNITAIQTERCSNVKDIPWDSQMTAKPLAVVFKHNSMTSVAAKRKGSWTGIYIGTANGQLIKFVLDTDYKSGCPKVLYRADDDRMVFPKILFDPVDHNYIYIALRNQIKRVAVAECGMYSTMTACIGSMDPFCGWCGNTRRCSMQEQCPGTPWISMSHDSFKKKLMSFQVANLTSREINLNLQLHLNPTESLHLACTFKAGGVDLCNGSSSVTHGPKCSCSFPEKHLSFDGLKVTVIVTVSNQTLTENLTLRSCPNITQCAVCVSAGCNWQSQTCSWAPENALFRLKQDKCSESSKLGNMPEILSLQPSEVSFHGTNNAVITGKNLDLVVKVRFEGFMACSFTETPVLERFNDTLKFHIPSGNKETVRVCVVTEDGRCHSNASVTYGSQPICTGLHPGVTWSSGERKIQVLGNNLEFVDAVNIHTSSKKIILNSSSKVFWFYSLNQKELGDFGPFSVSLSVVNSTVVCAGNLSYHLDPEFTNFTTSNVDNEVQVTIQKKEDRLNLSQEELKVWALQEEKEFECKIESIKPSVVICKISRDKHGEIKVDSLRIELTSVTQIVLMTESSIKYMYTLVALIILLLLGAVAGIFIHRKSQRQMNAQMNERLEMLENEIRNEIRQGFVDLQTESSDLVENVGAIPYLDYKHFALKILFPEGGPLANQMIREIGQDAMKAEMDERCQAFFALIRDPTFLTCFVHALEEQRTFSIKDKCTVASLLTVSLHSDLPYLTLLMEELLQSLMDQPSNAQPKLLLRRTESIVEKLLTNWMSICLYGFLRESVGQPLFLMISALNQQISKGPVDAVTEKALYTLNEDWLLWQAQGFNFSPLKLKVLFAVGMEGEVSEPLDVNVLTCDTIEQVKDKILQTFQRKFGFRYTQQLRDIGIEYIKEGSYMPLEEVDGSSEVQGEVTMLNTLKHYDIPDGASIKVITKKVHAPLSPQTSLKDDQNFTTKYFHLIDPDIDADQSEHPERKKLKLKEIYLTKLLSTKVAVHSFVESLFRNIWGMPNNKAPPAVKYFFDFLDSQAEKKKIMDPDVLHIWKTNSLPLRFWVNILKNPNFVFSDLEKTPHMDACLSVIAQAFMDSFSLADHQLGKHAPTNKLLYAKDIPQYKQEVKMYYKLVRDQPSASSQDFKVFLQEESKKHENEFNESAALRELYKYMKRYFSEIEQHLEQNDAPCGLKEELHRVKELFESVKRSAWI